MRNLGILLLLIITTACGGGDSDNKQSVNSKSALVEVKLHGTGGTVTPAQQDVTQGAKANFQLELEPGVGVTKIEGCNAYLNEDQQIIIDAVAQSCTVNVHLVNQTYTITYDIKGFGQLEQVQEGSHGLALNIPVLPETDQKVKAITGCGGELREEVYHIPSMIQDCHIDAEFTSLFDPHWKLPEIIRLPVVVHVMQDGELNITDAQIVSQLQQTNQHFRATNQQELATIPALYKDYIGDTGIQFYLATQAPDGTPTNGINRQATTAYPLLTERAYSAQGGIDAWDTERYINIWVGEMRNRNNRVFSLGKAFIPERVNPQEIGVTVEYGVFGTLPPRLENYDQGKTLTHELGHFFGLIGHIKEGEAGGHRFASCDNIYLVTDCINQDLEMNFMRANVYDEQLKMFSVGQVQIMRDWLTQGPLKTLYQNSLRN